MALAHKLLAVAVTLAGLGAGACAAQTEPPEPSDENIAAVQSALEDQSESALQASAAPDETNACYGPHGPPETSPAVVLPHLPPSPFSSTSFENRLKEKGKPPPSPSPPQTPHPATLLLAQQAYLAQWAQLEPTLGGKTDDEKSELRAQLKKQLLGAEQ